MPSRSLLHISSRHAGRISGPRYQEIYVKECTAEVFLSYLIQARKAFVLVFCGPGKTTRRKNTNAHVIALINHCWLLALSVARCRSRNPQLILRPLIHRHFCFGLGFFCSDIICPTVFSAAAVLHLFAVCMQHRRPTSFSSDQHRWSATA